MPKYGFLGLGIMGAPMAANLVRAGHEVIVWNRTAGKCAPLLDLGAQQASTAAEAVAESDITFAMLADPAAAESVVFGPAGVLEGMSTGKGYVDMSTVDENTSRNIAEAVNDAGGRFLEAPVSGTKKPAEDGTLVILVAGDELLYDEVGPLLDVMGKKHEVPYDLTIMKAMEYSGAHRRLALSAMAGCRRRARYRSTRRSHRTAARCRRRHPERNPDRSCCHQTRWR